MLSNQKCNYQDVTAIITAMTDGEQPFLFETVSKVLSDPAIGQAILCVDKNNTWLDEVLGSLARDSRLEIVRLPLAPAPAVRNHALEYVQFPWIAYCDGDDIWCKGKTLKQRAYADEMNCDFVGADHFLTNETGRICAVAQARYIPMPSSWLVRTEVMKQFLFDETTAPAEDGDWWIRTNGLIKKARYPQLLIRYRVRSGSISSSTPSKQRKAKVVAVAEMPIIGLGVLFVTWFAWLFNRRSTYVWLNTWGQEDSAKTQQTLGQNLAEQN